MDELIQGIPKGKKGLVIKGQSNMSEGSRGDEELKGLRTGIQKRW